MTTPTEWLLGNDTGVSSETICAVMTGSDIYRSGRPHDPADFGRCYRLLALFPEWTARIPEVATRFPEWRPLVAIWPELTAMYEGFLRTREVHGEIRYPDVRTHLRITKAERAAIAAYRAHPTTAAWDAMYQRMREIDDECMIAGGWTRVGPGSWKKERAR